MRLITKIIFVVSFFFIADCLSAQAFWTETFGTGCDGGNLASAYSGANGAWTVASTGTNQADHNIWYVSAEENGNAVGVCGSACGSDRSLHISSSPDASGDVGAAYLVALCFIYCSMTNERAASPIINCSGKSNITIGFDYIENGEGSDDNATLWYSANGGSTWSQIADMAKTSLCPSGQGLWAAFSMMLPASANNNPNVKIGFNWTNNQDGAGTDPSIAVDDITLSVSAPLSVTLKNFSAIQSGKNVQTEWVTLSEKNNSHFVVERSSGRNPEGFYNIGIVAGKGTSDRPNFYQLIDEKPNLGINYYRLKTIDNNGNVAYSKTVAVNFQGNTSALKIIPNPTNSSFQIKFFSPKINSYQIQIANMFGQLVYQKNIRVAKGYNIIKQSPALESGIYEIRLIGSKTQLIGKLEVSK